MADFSDDQLASFKAALEDAGVSVSAIGSPIGKIDVRAAFRPELDRMRRIADIADALGTRIVRVFSFFIPDGESPLRYRSRVIDQMAALAAVAAERGLVLAHENEKLIYGDVPQRCADIITPMPTACYAPTSSMSRSRTHSERPARSCRPATATVRFARRWAR